MSNNQWNRLSFMGILLIISLLLLNIRPMYPIDLQIVKLKFPVDPVSKDIYVPPAEDSHRNHYHSVDRINVSNTWKNLQHDNNIPGLLPGPKPGEQLGLENNPELSLLTPIKAPLLDNAFPRKCNSKDNYMNSVKNNILKGCLLTANEKANFETLPASVYYKYRFQQCNPYNGSYCQCTNNYIPLPPVGLC